MQAVGQVFGLLFAAIVALSSDTAASQSTLPCPATATAEQCAEHWAYVAALVAPAPLQPGWTIQANWPDLSVHGAAVTYRENVVRPTGNGP